MLIIELKIKTLIWIYRYNFNKQYGVTYYAHSKYHRQSITTSDIVTQIYLHFAIGCKKLIQFMNV